MRAIPQEQSHAGDYYSTKQPMKAKQTRNHAQLENVTLELPEMLK